MLICRIIPFQPQYRDDTIFCLLSAKNALGKVPRLNEDLLDIKKNYFDKNDMFYIAINTDNRVIGMLGTNTVSETDMWLKRLYIRPDMKRKGIASSLLSAVETYAKTKNIKRIHTRFSDNYVEAACFYPLRGFVEDINMKSDGLKLRYLIKNIT